eukprot:SAG31_NODE_2361_length_5869_cov_3.154246_7_plen_338_part_00
MMPASSAGAALPVAAALVVLALLGPCASRAARLSDLTPAEIEADAAAGRPVCGMPACRLPAGQYVYALAMAPDRAQARACLGLRPSADHKAPFVLQAELDMLGHWVVPVTVAATESQTSGPMTRSRQCVPVQGKPSYRRRKDMFGLRGDALLVLRLSITFELASGLPHEVRLDASSVAGPVSAALEATCGAGIGCRRIIERALAQRFTGLTGVQRRTAAPSGGADPDSDDALRPAPPSQELTRETWRASIKAVMDQVVTVKSTWLVEDLVGRFCNGCRQLAVASALAVAAPMVRSQLNIGADKQFTNAERQLALATCMRALSRNICTRQQPFGRSKS